MPFRSTSWHSDLSKVLFIPFLQGYHYSAATLWPTLSFHIWLGSGVFFGPAYEQLHVWGRQKQCLCMCEEQQYIR